MAHSESLAERIRHVLARKRGIEEKKMFGGVGFLLHGHMLVGVWKNSLIVRLDPKEYEAALEEPSVSPFNITGRAMRGWVMVGAEGHEHDETLAAWIERATKYVRKLPSK